MMLMSTVIGAEKLRSGYEAEVGKKWGIKTVVVGVSGHLCLGAMKKPLSLSPLPSGSHSVQLSAFMAGPANRAGGFLWNGAASSRSAEA